MGGALRGECVFIYIDLAKLSAYAKSLLESLQVDADTVETSHARAVLSNKSSVSFYAGLFDEFALQDTAALKLWATKVLRGDETPVRVINTDA